MRRLLYIAHRVPYPPDKGERVRAFEAIKALSGRFRVTVAALTHTPGEEMAAEGLRTWCEKVMVAKAAGGLGLLRGAASLAWGGSVTGGFFHSRRLLAQALAEARAEPFAVAMAYCSSMVPLALQVPAAAHVADLVDADSAKWADYSRASRWPRRWLYAAEAHGVRRLEDRALDECDAVVLTSRAELATLGWHGPKATAVGNGVDAAHFAPDAAQAVRAGGGPSLVFVGTMNYRPNADAVCWFAQHVWPALRSALAGATFAIVGRDPTAEVRRLGKFDGITVTGAVPDVRPYVAGADVAIAPLRIARGVQNKVLEAMAMGKAVVASPAALGGIDAVAGSDLLRADSPDEWTQCLLSVLGDAPLRRRLGQAARQCVLERYNWQARMAPLVDLCLRLAGPAQPAGRTTSAPGAIPAVQVVGASLPEGRP